MALSDIQPGDVLAGRYRMVARIGRGGMGDVWRADDDVLRTPVALKVMNAAGDAARARLLNEVRLARQITHPAVCRVFDVGEANGRVFFSMEYVEGEDLASLIRRAGRLPSSRVVDIARQLCDGLAAAHAQGVLHRDLKPANILIDADGRVVITDFGIAVTTAGETRHTVVGTPGYMAPEQLTANARVTEQTDIYALGLVLYECLTGRHPHQLATPLQAPVKPSAVTADVDPRLERAVLRALAADPARRPPSAAAFAEEIAGAAGGPPARGSRRGVVVGAGLAALIALIALAAFLVGPRDGATLTEQDVIVLADFANTTGEPVFDGALKVALAVALEQSPFLKVFSEERVRETLRLMERPATTPITRSVAREIAVREHLKALIAGSIARLGAHYVVALEAVNAESGDVMARDQVEAGSREEVLGALGAAAARLRERVGESLASVERFNAPLPRATTSSLEALHAYAQALDNGRMNMTRDIVPQLRRAIELDPDFALAQAMLSGTYTNLGLTALAPPHSRRAFELRDRVSERERFVISWRYYRDALQSWTRALEIARTWAATYPRDSLAFNSVGLALLTMGQFEEAVEPLYTAMRLEPRSVAPPENLAVVLTSLGRLDEAKRVLADARQTQRYTIGQAHRRYLIAVLEGDTAAVARLIEEARQQPNGRVAGDWQPKVDAFDGRVSAAIEGFRASAAALRYERLDQLAASHLIEGAEVLALAGRCGDAVPETADALALTDDNFTLERASRALAWCGQAAKARTLLADLEQRFPEATLTHDLDVPVTRALLALVGGDPAAALAILEPVRRYDAASSAEFWPAFLRGRAYLALHQPDRAAGELQQILDHRSYHPERPLYPLAHVERARAAAQSGDTALARRHYEAFFALWKNADADLQPLIEARREYAALR
jgi:tetratricopeptide (TPR) repeat protein/predicted Ser/Thr protein kinase